MKIDEFILENRQRKHLTQAELARQLNVSNTTISNYENGVSMPDVTTLMEMADIFETSLDGISNNRLSAFSSLTGKLLSFARNLPKNSFKLIEADKYTQYYPFIEKGDFLYIRKIRKQPPAGALILIESSDVRRGIYKLAYGKSAYLLLSCTPNKEPCAYKLSSLTSDMWEIVSITHFCLDSDF